MLLQTLCLIVVNNLLFCLAGLGLLGYFSLDSFKKSLDGVSLLPRVALIGIASLVKGFSIAAKTADQVFNIALPLAAHALRTNTRSPTKPSVSVPVPVQAFGLPKTELRRALRPPVLSADASSSLTVADPRPASASPPALGACDSGAPRLSPGLPQTQKSE
jgi:hypothetical protein